MHSAQAVKGKTARSLHHMDGGAKDKECGDCNQDRRGNDAIVNIHVLIITFNAIARRAHFPTKQSLNAKRLLACTARCAAARRMCLASQ